ncbi:hypothetical protein O181_028831 [Austropuccinia psidii MF-1]|uniref:Uncharacterized protein n=1 Tax=Austropuccinia psidii MF-1 TaxID=1389203 RepID=A0A9Q3H2R8_9BASI|nr:hypothetical protein [Austropuccinia psidii MF-1]
MDPNVKAAAGRLHLLLNDLHAALALAQTPLPPFVTRLNSFVSDLNLVVSSVFKSDTPTRSYPHIDKRPRHHPNRQTARSHPSKLHRQPPGIVHPNLTASCSGPIASDAEQGPAIQLESNFLNLGALNQRVLPLARQPIVPPNVDLPCNEPASLSYNDDHDQLAAPFNPLPSHNSDYCDDDEADYLADNTYYPEPSLDPYDNDNNHLDHELAPFPYDDDNNHFDHQLAPFPPNNFGHLSHDDRYNYDPYIDETAKDICNYDNRPPDLNYDGSGGGHDTSGWY